MSRHNYHGAEYVDDHTDREQEKYAEEQSLPVEVYSSLEEILADINNVKMFPYHILKMVPSIKEKLQATIRSGKYLQNGTE